MNRQIKFRGKDAFKTDCFPAKWWYGGIMIDGEDVWLCAKKGNDAIISVKVVPETVGQFTGFKDRNGKEIYEGDIITVMGRLPRVVLWDKVSWAIMPCMLYNDKRHWIMELQHPEYDWWKEFADDIEVIGNIYDNPEFVSNKKIIFINATSVKGK